jgi:hypothetical protein
LINLANFGADGTLAVATPSPAPAPPGAGHRLEFWTAALGTWAATDERAAVMTFMTLGADENGNPVGSHIITATLTASADGQALQGPFQIAVNGPDGSPRATATGTVTATRIAPSTAS